VFSDGFIPVCNSLNEASAFNQDNLHINSEGHKIIAQSLIKSITNTC